MKFNKLYQLLEKDSWYIERTKRHHIYSHPTKKGKIPDGKHGFHFDEINHFYEETLL